VAGASAESVAVMQKRFYSERCDANGEPDPDSGRRRVARQGLGCGGSFDDAGVGHDPPDIPRRFPGAQDVVLPRIPDLLQCGEIRCRIGTRVSADQ